jgi:hypothetical protein
MNTNRPVSPGAELMRAAHGKKFGTILADPPWQFQNKTGKIAPEHKRLARYGTMTLPDILELGRRDCRTNRPPLSVGAKCDAS